MLHRSFDLRNMLGTRRHLHRHSVLLAAIAALLILTHPVMGQLSALDLESPILPGGSSVAAPVQTAQPMHNASTAVHGPGVGHIPNAASASVPMHQGQFPVGSSFPGQKVNGGQVAQASFIGCSSCGSVGCSGCDDYGAGFAAPPGIGMWIRADYLSWFESGMDVTPLVTSSTGIPADTQTLLTLGAAETNIEFGGRDYDNNSLDGWRIEVGAWLDAGATFGILGRYFSTEEHTTSFGANSVFSEGFNDFNFLGIPFFNPDGDLEDALDIAVLNEREGALAIDIESQLSSWEILFRRLAETGPNYRLDWLYGYRNLRLDESLNLSARTVVTDAAAGTLGTDIVLNDSFEVENQFHGIDLGITGHSREGCWSLDFLVKVALGVMNQEVIVDGSQLISIPDIDPTRNIGGLFSQESNLGSNDNDEFGVIPEFDVNLGYAITPNLDFTVGYTFIYVHGMVRAGSVIDRTVDPGLALDLDPVNSNRPQLNFDNVNYHIHGLNLGVTARF